MEPASLASVLLMLTVTLSGGIQDFREGDQAAAIKQLTTVIEHRHANDGLREQAYFFRAQAYAAADDEARARRDMLAAFVTMTDSDLLAEGTALYKAWGGNVSDLPLPDSPQRVWYQYLRACQAGDHAALLRTLANGADPVHHRDIASGALSRLMALVAARAERLSPPSVTILTEAEELDAAEPLEASLTVLFRPDGKRPFETPIIVKLRATPQPRVWHIESTNIMRVFAQAEGGEAGLAAAAKAPQRPREPVQPPPDPAMNHDQQNMQMLANALMIHRGRADGQQVVIPPPMPPAMDEPAEPQAPAPPPRDPTPQERQRVEQLVTDLGSRDADVRKAARRELEDLGPVAKPLLQPYKNHDDPEIRLTVRELLAE